jgi:hypothetical protein
MKGDKFWFIIQLIILCLAGIGIPFYVLIENVYPSFTYYFSRADDNSVKIMETNNQQGYFLSLPILSQYPFVTMKFKSEANDVEEKLEKRVRVAKGFLAQTYPQGEMIKDDRLMRELLFYDNKTTIPNGSLVSYNDAVYLITRGIARPFLSPQAFESMGFRWDLVQPIDSTVFSLFTEGEKIVVGTAHPDGVILKNAAGKYFLVWEGMLRPISDYDVIVSQWKTFYWVDVDKEYVEYLTECNLQQKGKTYKCRIILPRLRHLPGDNLLLKVEPGFIGGIKEARIDLKTRIIFEKDYLQYALGQIKSGLYLRYFSAGNIQ